MSESDQKKLNRREFLLSGTMVVAGATLLAGCFGTDSTSSGTGIGTGTGTGTGSGSGSGSGTGSGSGSGSGSGFPI